VDIVLSPFYSRILRTARRREDGVETQKTRGRVVLVVGASSGIGRACAVLLAREGNWVFGTTRRPAADIDADLRRDVTPCARLDVIALDVDDPHSVHSAVDTVLARAGRLDAVVHCAGFGIGGAIEDTAEDEAEAIFRTNSLGTLRVCRAALPVMREQGAGRIVVVSSIAGRVAVPFQGLYSATKFALEGLCEALRMEVRPFGVHVTLVEPGDFRTGFTDRRLRVRASRIDGAYSESCRRALEIAESDERRASTPERVARLVSRILSRRAPRLRYTVGPTLQRAAVRLKSVLPSRVFEWALGLYYRA